MNASEAEAKVRVVLDELVADGWIIYGHWSERIMFRRVDDVNFHPSTFFELNEEYEPYAPKGDL